MKIYQVKEYNRLDMQRYNERVREWRESRSNNIIPQIAFVGFRNDDGELKQKGYVVVSDNFSSAHYYKNETEAIKSLSVTTK